MLAKQAYATIHRILNQKYTKLEFITYRLLIKRRYGYLTKNQISDFSLIEISEIPKMPNSVVWFCGYLVYYLVTDSKIRELKRRSTALERSNKILYDEVRKLRKELDARQPK